MNYLAHAFLGSHQEGELVGQLIADEIKGGHLEMYPSPIELGIRMHRWVDQTTDQSLHLETVKQLLRPVLGRFTGIALDVIMDYYLSKHWLQYHPTPLPDFIAHVYLTLDKNRLYWPPKGHFRLEKMIEQNWLARYATMEGIALTMKQMAIRKPILHPLTHCSQLVEKHTVDLDRSFHLLIHELIVGYKSKINTFATLPPDRVYKDGQAK